MVSRTRPIILSPESSFSGGAIKSCLRFHFRKRRYPYAHISVSHFRKIATENSHCVTIRWGPACLFKNPLFGVALEETLESWFACVNETQANMKSVIGTEMCLKLFLFIYLVGNCAILAIALPTDSSNATVPK